MSGTDGNIVEPVASVGSFVSLKLTISAKNHKYVFVIMRKKQLKIMVKKFCVHNNEKKGDKIMFMLNLWKTTKMEGTSLCVCICEAASGKIYKILIK